MTETGDVIWRETVIPPYTASRYYLDLRFDEVHLSWNTGGFESGITGRPIEEYEQMGAIPKGFLDQRDSKALSVIEIAPGLAEFLPIFAKCAFVKPVAVDVIDYGEVADFLEASLSSCSVKQREICNKMIERARTIMRLVDYIRCPVEQLEYGHPDLKGRFDMAVYYPGVIHEDGIAKYLKSWLEKKGSLNKK